MIVQVEGSSAATLTDENGRFQLEGVKTGPVVLLFEAPEYQPLRLELSVEQQRFPIAVSLS